MTMSAGGERIKYPGPEPERRTVAEPPRRRHAWVAALFVWTGVCWFWAAGAVFIVPRLESVYQEMKIELPTATKAVVGACHIISASYAWVGLIGAPIAIPFVVRASANPRVAGVALLVAGYLMAALSIGAVASLLFLPLSRLIEMTAS